MVLHLDPELDAASLAAGEVSDCGLSEAEQQLEAWLLAHAFAGEAESVASVGYLLTDARRGGARTAVPQKGTYGYFSDCLCVCIL